MPFWVVISFYHAKNKNDWTRFYLKYEVVPDEFMKRLEDNEREAREITLKRERMKDDAEAAKRARTNDEDRMRRERDAMSANDPHYRHVWEERAFQQWWGIRGMRGREYEPLVLRETAWDKSVGAREYDGMLKNDLRLRSYLLDYGSCMGPPMPEGSNIRFWDDHFGTVH